MELILNKYSIKNNKFFKKKQLSKDSLESFIKKSFIKEVKKELTKNIHVTVIQNTMILNLLTAMTDSYFGNRHEVLSLAPTIIMLSQSKSSLKSNYYDKENNIPVTSPSIKVEKSMIDSAKSCGLKGISINEVCHVLSANQNLLAELNVPRDYIPTKMIALGYSKKSRITSGKKYSISKHYIV